MRNTDLELNEFLYDQWELMWECMHGAVAEADRIIALNKKASGNGKSPDEKIIHVGEGIGESFSEQVKTVEFKKAVRDFIFSFCRKEVKKDRMEGLNKKAIDKLKCIAYDVKTSNEDPSKIRGVLATYESQLYEILQPRNNSENL
jgi:hypothetical protein